jgi:hypothetical protein
MNAERIFDNAQSNLDHYITLLMDEAGLKVDSDTHAELSEILDPIGELFIALEKRVSELETWVEGEQRKKMSW